MIGNFFPEIYRKNPVLTCMFIGCIYALIGIISARILFPNDPSIAAIAFTSLLILSDEVFSKMLFKNEDKSMKEAFLPYAALVFGVLAIYMVVSIMLPTAQLNETFRAQLSMDAGSREFNVNNLFYHIFLNNMIVSLIIFAFSIMMRGGGVFFLVWNASVWGTIVGASAKNIAMTTSQNPLIASTGFLLFVSAISLTFVLPEISAYVNSAVAGNKINEFVRHRNKRTSKVFNDAILIVTVSIVIIALAAYVEASIINNINPFSYFR